VGLQEKIYRLFDEQSARPEGSTKSVSTHWMPAVDIYETPQSFVLLAEIPGLDQNQIDLEISKDLLVLRGERPLNTSDSQFSYHRIERPDGAFQRSFRLPATVESAGARASYRDGVLEVTLPKGDRGAGRSVNVEIED
jgi:HSP20 family protein